MSDPFIPPVPNEPSFQVRREVLDGDFVRGPGIGDETYPDGFKGVLRYGVTLPEGLHESLLVSQSEGYDAIKLWWGTPPESFGAWTYMALVRSGFGHPSTPTDGEIILGMTYRPDDDVPGSYVDEGLPSGQWFYYSLMFRVGSRWHVVNTTEALVPVDYAHRDHLFNLLPPFYQDLDEETWAGTENSMLKRWFYTIGYDLDITRTLAEGIETIYDPDRGSMRLLGPLGEQNLGFGRNEALGDIRYRGLLASSREIQDQRGTYGGLQKYLSATTQYTVEISPGANLLLLGDDADFSRGHGNWCPTHFGLNREISAEIASTRRLTFKAGSTEDFDAPPLPPTLRELRYPVRTLAKVQAGDREDEHLVISCGVGQQTSVQASRSKPRTKVSRLRHLSPLRRGVPVDPDLIYYFSFWLAAPEGSETEYVVRHGFAFYEREIKAVGFSDAFGSSGFNSYAQIEPLGVDMTSSITVSDDSWNRYVMSAGVPEGARFAVPVIWVYTPGPLGSDNGVFPSPVYVTAAMVNSSQSVGVDTVYRPNYHLVLTADVGNETDVLGEDSGKVMGEP